MIAKSIRIIAGPQTVTVTIKVEEPVFLTLEAGNSDEYEAEIRDLRIELSNVHRQLDDSHAQLADNGGSLRIAQEQLAESHDALSLERQKTMDLMREIKDIPLPSDGASATVTSSDNEELSQRSRSWAADRDGTGVGPGSGTGHRPTFASTAYSGLDKATTGQVQA